MTTMSEADKVKFYLEEAHRYFDVVNEARRKIDDKINNFIALSGVLVNVTLGLALLFFEKFNNTITLWLLLVSVSFYLLVIVIGLLCYRPSDFKLRDVKKIMDKFENQDGKYTLLDPIYHTAWNLSDDAGNNRLKVAKKAKIFEIMLVIFAIGILFLVFALATLASGTSLPLNANSGNFTR